MIMIKQIFQKLSLRTLFLHKYSNSKGLSESDELTQEQIDEILGNPISLKKQQKYLQEIKDQKEISEQKEMFYGLLPVKNENFPVCVDPDYRQIQQTPNQNIFKALSLPENCSFDEYTHGLQAFRSQVDLYGDEEEKTVVGLQDLEFKQLLTTQSTYLEFLRKNHMVNISIPGTIQCEDPRNFMQLRPIQSFRHTPLIPIAESTMKKHKQMLEEYHRRQFVFQVSTQSVINWTLIAGVCCIAGYFIYLIIQRQEERTIAYSRLKYQRITGQSEEIPVFKI